MSRPYLLAFVAALLAVAVCLALWFVYLKTGVVRWLVGS